MKDCFDIVNDVIGLINTPSVNAELTGKIWPHMMPNGYGYNTTDIVVGSMFGTNEPIQYSPVNIRIHAAGAFSASERYSFFSKVGDIIYPLIDDQYKGDFWTELISPGKEIEDTDGTWFYLIKVDWYHMQDNFRNI